MKISEHFSRNEFKCKCGQCGKDVVDKELNEVLEDLHFYLSTKYIGQRIYIEITSGNRCPAHNVEVGGEPLSQHLLGKAADIKGWFKWQQNQLDPDEIYVYLDRMYPNKYGIGRYDAFTHIDVRKHPARWDRRK